jgi:hypothetical protein
MSMDEIKKLEDENLNEVAGGRKSEEDVARDVLLGRYGDGNERVWRLKAAGYDPVRIQRIVNRMVSGDYQDPYKNPGTGNWNPASYVDPYK